MNISTIGTSKKSLRKFITLLKESKVDLVVDIRLHNTSQLAGFSKKDDLAYILELVGIEYIHLPNLAPTEEIFKSYRSKNISPEEFASVYKELLKSREVLTTINSLVNSHYNTCFLCSEDSAKDCHRKTLVDFYLESIDEEIIVQHLK